MSYPTKQELYQRLVDALHQLETAYAQDQKVNAGLEECDQDADIHDAFIAAWAALDNTAEDMLSLLAIWDPEDSIAIAHTLIKRLEIRIREETEEQ